MPATRQTNFNAGELAPGFWGRTDVEKFATGMRRLRNFFVNEEGAAVSRPGTTFVAETKLGADSAVRLIPFVYSDSQSYVLEFGDEYIRFHTGGGPVMVIALPYYAYEVGTPYAAADLAGLQWSQSGDVLTLTHPSYPPKELKRYGHIDWRLEDVSFARLGPFFKDPASPYTPTLEPMVILRNEDGELVWPTTADATHPAQEWRWKVTVMAQDTATGVTFETLPVDVTWAFNGTDADPPAPGATPILSNVFALYPDQPITLRRPETSGLISEPPGWDSYKVLAFNFYRGRGDLYGFVGQTKSRDFVDVGEAPNYAERPPLGQNPFKVYDTDGNLVRTEKPSCSAYFQDRRVFAGTTERPEYLFFSKTSDYANFDEDTILIRDDSALLFALLSRKREVVRSLLVMDRLLAFTSSCVWSIAGSGADGGKLTPTSLDFRVVEEIGISSLPPLVVDGCALFVRAKGQGVRAIVPANNSSGYQGVDLSVLSRHLFLAKPIVDWCYQEDPFGLVWAVRDDGVLLSLQFSPTDTTWAWTRHDTDDVGFRACCAIPETDEDYVYVVVDRTIDGTPKRYIERLTSRLTKDSVDDNVCLDCAVKFQGAPTDTITGLDHLEGRTVYATGKDLPVYGPLTVTGGSITLSETPAANNGSNLTLYAGLLFTPEAETLDVISTDVRLKQKTVKQVGFEVDNSRGLYVGQDLEHLTEWRQRSVADSYGAVGAATELVRVAVNGRWDEGGRAAVRQTLPLPVTLLGITRDLDFGG